MNDTLNLDTLKPCPFCGRRGTLGYSGQPATKFFIVCVGCGACGPEVESGSAAGGVFNSECVEKWNTRS